MKSKNKKRQGNKHRIVKKREERTHSTRQKNLLLGLGLIILFAIPIILTYVIPISGIATIQENVSVTYIHGNEQGDYKIIPTEQGYNIELKSKPGKQLEEPGKIERAGMVINICLIIRRHTGKSMNK